MLRRVFKAFSYQHFRMLWMGACTSSIGTWMQQVAQAWMVFEMSKSAFMLGLDTALGQIPILLFSLVGGVVADRMDRRHLLIGSQVVQMTCAFTLTALIVTGLVRVWMILVLSFVVGTAQAFGGPAYQALVPTLVDKEDLQNAIALNSIQFNLARFIGPSLGGWALARFGAQWCFALNGLSFIAVIISILRLPINFMPGKIAMSMVGSLKEGLVFVRHRSAMAGLIVIAFFMTAFTAPMLTFLPVFAKEVYHGNALTYTNMMSISALGSVTGALIVAGFGNVSNKGRIALLILTVLGLGITIFATSRNIWFSYGVLFVLGALLMGAFAMISSLVQLVATNEMRGRVMSVYNVAFRGGMPLGSLVTGRLIPIFSAPMVVGVNGILLVSLAIYFLLAQRRVAAL
ncbi:MAG TPA: MFS transporter [Solibacterales bacterium]|nr:MFS transporter [Bryobacterales bacterium]